MWISTNWGIITFSYHPGKPKIVEIKINKINPNPIEHFVPKLPKKNCLVIPLGNKEVWDNKIVDRDKDTEQTFPDCLIACDDIDGSKMELELYNDVLA